MKLLASSCIFFMQFIASCWLPLQEYYSCSVFLHGIGDFWDAWWQQTFRVNSIVLGSVRMLRAT